MHRLLISAAVAFIAVCAIAQPQPAVSESIDVTVIELDVAVLDASGNPVRGLTRDDFELTIGGRRREITNFYAVERPTAAENDGTATASPGPPPRRNYLVLFIDDLHLRNADKSRALAALRHFVTANVRGGTAAMLVTSNGDAEVKQAFTTDPAIIQHAIDSIEHQPAHADEYERERRELIHAIDTAGGETILIYRQQMQTLGEREKRSTEETMKALAQVVHATAGLDGRRVVVYVSSGLPMQPAVEIFDHYKPELHEGAGTTRRSNRAIGDMTALDTMQLDLGPAFRQLAADTAAMGVQFFAIDAAGLRGFESSDPQNPSDPGLNSKLIRSNLDAPLQLLADETGGRAIVDRNNLDDAFSELTGHLSTYYSLGFRSDGSRRQQDVRVTVRRRGLTVRAARSVRERNYRQQIEDAVRARLYASDEVNPLGAELTAHAATSSNEAAVVVRVPVDVLSILPERNAAFDVYVTMLDESMRESPLRVIRHAVMPDETGAAVQSIALRAKPGRYTVSFAVVDALSWQTSYFQRKIDFAGRN